MHNFKLIASVSVSAIAVTSTCWVASFRTHSNFKSFKSNIEFAPDFLVTYECDTYERLKGLHMDDHGDTVTVNYGGLGRRRGFRNFVCLSK